MDEDFYISVWLRPDGSYIVCADSSAEECYDNKQVRIEQKWEHIRAYQTPDFSCFSVLDDYFKQRGAEGPVTDEELAEIFRR